MTSPRKIRSNQANAGHSTGPRTALGKATASRNARSHGLSSDEGLDLKRAAAIAELMAGPVANAARRSDALVVGYAICQLDRIAALRRRFLADLITAQTETLLYSPGRARDQTKLAFLRLAKIERYAASAFSSLRKAFQRI
jgi:hypothetical protein